jgi:hypothetical protein
MKLPEVMVIQVTLLTAVQAQSLGAVTVTEAVPPLITNDWLVGDMEAAQEVPPYS